ncbi:hypothetical protein [Microbacterium sp.]|uniref:hypothetical protein n=1 Tax=Microbacterium sp. TaxID=51671 RepID=UPI002810A82C|nr:hypothetical protein [Microbacterium sp.]
MSDSTAGTPAPESGANDQGPDHAPDADLEATAMRSTEDLDDDLTIHDDVRTDVGGPDGPHSAGDTLGGAQAPTGNDGTMGADTPTGDASLADADVNAAALSDGADTPSEVFGADEE